MSHCCSKQQWNKLYLCKYEQNNLVFYVHINVYRDDKEALKKRRENNDREKIKDCSMCYVSNYECGKTSKVRWNEREVYELVYTVHENTEKYQNIRQKKYTRVLYEVLQRLRKGNFRQKVERTLKSLLQLAKIRIQRVNYYES